MTTAFKVLFIDDNSIDEELDTINRALVKNNIRVDSHVVNMKLPQFFKRDPKDGPILSADQIKRHLFDEGIMDTAFDIVACDFNFSDPYYDGYKLLINLINNAKKHNKIIRNAKFLFYTGDTSDLEKIAGSDLKRLLPLKVEFIIDREHLPQELIRLIQKSRNEINVEKMFLSYLDEHRDKKFISTFPRFSGKNLSYIADEIEKGSDDGKAFLESLIEQSVSHLIALQEG